MAKTYNIIFTVCLFLITLSGCGEQLMDYSIETDTPVVESYLQEGSNTLSVNVYSMEVYLKNDEVKLSKPVSGLNIKINGELLEETTSGTYQLTTDTLREGQTYDLQFDHNGKSIEATTTIPAQVRNLRVEPESLALTSYYMWDMSDTAEVVNVSWDDPGNNYYQVYIESPNVSDMPSFGIFGRRMMQPFRGNTYRATARDFRSTGTHWIYIYRVDEDYAELFERVSSSDLANPVSFIRNAFGIFTSMSIARVGVYVYESSE